MGTISDMWYPYEFHLIREWLLEIVLNRECLKHSSNLIGASWIRSFFLFLYKNFFFCTNQNEIYINNNSDTPSTSSAREQHQLKFTNYKEPKKEAPTKQTRTNTSRNSYNVAGVSTSHDNNN